MKKRSSGLFGLIFLCVFLTPFLIGGLVMLGIGVNHLREGAPLTDEDVFVPLAIGVVFTAVSLGFLSAVIYGHRKQKQQNALREQFPDEPWQWNEEWRSGTVASSNPVGLAVLWLFAIVFSGFGVPLTIRVWLEAGSEGLAGVFITGIFALIGLGMLAAAIRGTIAWFRFGQSYCELITNPGVIGGWFKGAVHSRVPIGPNDTIQSRLSCIRRYTTGSGKNKSTHEDIKWQEARTVEGGAVEMGSAGGTIIPIAFYIPRDCQATTMEDASDRILWRLEVNAAVPGVDYSARFEVPVFVTPESSDQVPEEAHAAYALSEDQVRDYGRTSKIRVRSAPEGGTEIYVPPRRTIGVALGATAFFLVWTGVVGVMVTQGAPLFMTAIFALVDVLIFCFVVSQWLGSTRTVINRDGITIRRGILGIESATRVDPDDINKVDIDIGMKSGNRAYYRVNLYIDEKKKHAVAGGIGDKNEARWLASVVETSVEAQ